MAEKKYSSLAILDILVSYSDENHILSNREILDMVEKKYQLRLERRTLYSNLDILEQNDIKINRYEQNGKGYFLESRQFTKAEVLLLCNAIHASHFISKKQSKQLIDKLLKTLSKYQKDEYISKVYYDNKLKSSGEHLLENIPLISEAIKDNKLLEFDYLTYNTNKKLIKKRESSYKVEPRYIVYKDSRAYLIATNPKYNDYTHYRIDRMANLKIVDEKVRALTNQKDAYEYSENKLFMYSGAIETIKFLCHQRILDHMIDTFGQELSLIPQDDEHFVIFVKTSFQGAKFLAQQYLGSIKILEPQALKQEFKQELQKALDSYSK